MKVCYEKLYYRFTVVFYSSNTVINNDPKRYYIMQVIKKCQTIIMMGIN